MKKLHARNLLAILLAVAMIFTMAACGAPKEESAVADTKTEAPKEETKTEVPKEDASDEPVELSVWVPTGSNDVWFQSVVDAFEEEHPDIKLNVEVQDFNEYYTILKTALLSDEAPDVTWCSANHMQEYIDAGYAMELNGFYEQYNWANPLGAALVEQISADGTQYYLPVDAPFGSLYFYNKDIFNELGLSEPTTDAEMFEVCKTLRDAGYIVAAGNKDNYILQNLYQAMLQGAMTEEEKLEHMADPNGYDYASEASVTAMTRLYQYFEKVYSEGANAMSVADTEALMVAGKAAIVQKDTYWLGADRISSKMPNGGEELGTFFLPGANDASERFYAAGITACYFILKDTEKADAAAELLDFLISEASQQMGAKAGMAPIAQGIQLGEEAAILLAENVAKRADVRAEVFISTYLNADMTDATCRIIQDAYAGAYATPQEACEAINAAR